MTVQSIKITNLLSFDELEVKDLKDMNCIVGRNNVGKSNLLKALKFFYNKLDGKEEISPKLHSNYSYKGTISVTFDTTRIYRITRKKPNDKYFSFISRKLIPAHKRGIYALNRFDADNTSFTLTLNIYNDGSVKWLTKDKKTRNLILYLYPFFHIEPRHMDLHEWDSLWDLISRLKSFNLSRIDDEAVINFFDESINSAKGNSYRTYINELNDIISTKPSTPKEKVLSYIKAGLKGYKFEIDENDLKIQSDGTNSFHFIKIFLKILVTISKREYITPFVFIDEPELGLHPKMNEVLIHDIYNHYQYIEGSKSKLARPKVFITTHSPNIVKEVIKRFRDKQNVYNFQKSNDLSTNIKLLNSTYDNESFINIFSDNEARLFFSDFILFVEGETELEIFGNMKLSKHFPHLNNIDIYKSSSNVVGERINPSYSNSAIPYMFLFDADKAIKLCGSPGDFSLKYNSNGDYFKMGLKDLEKERNKYKLGFNEKYRSIKSNVTFLINNLSKKVEVDITKQEFSPKLEFEFIFNAIKKHLLMKNFYICRTTIEGCLIQDSSSEIFYNWLNEKYKIDMNPVFDRINNNKNLTENMLIDYMRVIFNGKTKTLMSYKSFHPESYKQLIKSGKEINSNLLNTSKLAKAYMSALETSTISNKMLGKTDGWTTSFINFAIDQIEKECCITKQTFGSVFKLHFPELYDIIRMLQPDSRGKI
ncbi:MULTISPECIES: retron Eco8 family effector endonuclease [Shewanella]|uniref:Retron Eco8 family effector endonuclease n=1 Tax=Shewanella vaxholmensis TaxID=3063535 RepID=A0ABU9UQQ5_9GAMM|nr:retron Eco8 family effector endonuclease [Shewanella sp. SP2S2-6]MDT3295437.1 retron Eco8 family effector endonuclease [Shewanella sp. SP2S2-6]